MVSGIPSSSYRRLAADTVTIQFGRALQLLLNIATFVLLARGLGPIGFGLFSTIVAVINTGYALADLGFGQLATRAIAQHNTREIVAIQAGMPLLYAAATAVLAVSGLISWFLTRDGTAVLFSATCLGLSYLHVQARVCVERGFWLGDLQVGRATLIDVVAAAARLFGVAAVWIAGGRSMTLFSTGIAVAGLLGLWVIHQWLTYPRTQARPAAGDRRTTVIEAAPFALSSLAWNAFAEMPKMLLAPFAGPAAVGQLGAASRLLNAAQLPLQSLLNVMTPRLFASARAPTDPQSPKSRTFLRSMALVTGSGALVGAALAVCAPVVPLVLGSAYEPSVPVLRILSVSLPFQALAFGTGDWLGGMGRQRARVAIMVFVVALAVPVLILGCAHGAPGAALGYTILTGTMALVTTVVCHRLMEK